MPITKARLKISDYNENRKSRLRTQEKRMSVVSLSLTSMVDMFAILVIFLLASMDTYSEWVQVGHSIDLPRAKSTEIPARAATLQISADTIYADDKELMKLSAASQNLGQLRQWLSSADKKNGYVNLVAHRKIPYGIMKKIVLACQEAGFKTVNLAVQP